MYKHILYEKKGGITYITLNRPEVLNAVNPHTSQELREAWTNFRDDPVARVAIFTGAGERAFSAGDDLKYSAEHHGEMWDDLATSPGGFGGITNHFECYKPMIAAVNGFALGGGFEMALACDIIIAAESARFGLPEPVVGLMAGSGGVQRLPRQIPLKLAMGMILTGRQITAQEAYRIGLVNEVVPLKELMPTAERWAREIVRCAPLAVRASKEAALKGLELPLEASINATYLSAELMKRSEDAAEGPRAFAEKRTPQWKGS